MRSITEKLSLLAEVFSNRIFSQTEKEKISLSILGQQPAAAPIVKKPAQPAKYEPTAVTIQLLRTGKKTAEEVLNALLAIYPDEKDSMVKTTPRRLNGWLKKEKGYNVQRGINEEGLTVYWLAE